VTRIVLSLAALALLAAAQPQAQSKPGAASRTNTKTAAASGVVNLNSASAAELEKLPGVGAATAARIIEYRQKKGPFKKIEELMNVQGIGEKSFLKLKPQITIGKAEEGQQ